MADAGGVMISGAPALIGSVLIAMKSACPVSTWVPPDLVSCGSVGAAAIQRACWVFDWARHAWVTAPKAARWATMPGLRGLTGLTRRRKYDPYVL